MRGLFTIDRLQSFAYEYSDSVHVAVYFEMNLSLTHYERTVYTVLDLLSDIGGLSGMLLSLFSALMGLWNKNLMQNTLAVLLFKVSTPGQAAAAPQQL